jgi:hypothetical protein
LGDGNVADVITGQFQGALAADARRTFVGFSLLALAWAIRCWQDG